MTKIDLKIRNLLEENSDTIILNDKNIDIINLDIEMFLSEIKELINNIVDNAEIEVKIKI